MSSSRQFTTQTAFTVGRSVEERELTVHTNFDLRSETPPPFLTLLLGGVHGDEPATTELLFRFQTEFLARGRMSYPVIVWAEVNPDGALRKTRYNARGVDLNRNCDFRWRVQTGDDEPSGDAPWSEPESRALRDLILTLRPAKIVTLHWALAEFDADGPQSRPLLESMWAALDESDRLPYRRRHSHQPAEDALHGSLGGWCGFGLKYPDGTAPAIVTLELPWDPAVPRGESLSDDHLAECQAHWRTDREGYMAAVTPAVFKALAAACAHQ